MHMSTDGTCTCLTVLLPATRVPPKVVRRSVHVCTTFQTYLCIYSIYIYICIHTYVDIILYCMWPHMHTVH